MNDWKSERTALTLIATTALLLVLTKENFGLSAGIFVVGLVFCLYEVLSRKNREEALQKHWLLLAIISGVVAYKFYSFAAVFLAAAFAIRFAASLIRHGDTAEISREVSEAVRKIQSLHAEELAELKKSLAAEAEGKFNRLKSDNIYTVAEYEQKLSRLRISLEEDYAEKIAAFESSHQAKCRDLETLLARNEKVFTEERIKLERERDLAEKEFRWLKDEELSALNDRLADQDELIKKLETNRAENQIFTNGELHKLLIDTLKTAAVEVDIMSPWVNFWIVNGEMQRLMENLLRRNVTIKLAYGIGNDNYFDAKSRNADVRDVVEKLCKRFEKYKNFRVKKINSHGKIFICDDKYYVLTSMNPLSNNGSSWEEIGERSNNSENLLRYREKYFSF